MPRTVADFTLGEPHVGSRSPIGCHLARADEEYARRGPPAADDRDQGYAHDRQNVPSRTPAIGISGRTTDLALSSPLTPRPEYSPADKAGVSV